MADLTQFLASSGKLRYQDFTTSGTFTPPAKLVANGGQCLVILIGGGGGGASSGGGVSSGLESGRNSTLRVQHTTILTPTTVTVGIAGAPGVGDSSPGSSGGTSSLGTISSTGGIGGAWYGSGYRAPISDLIEMYVPGNYGRGGAPGTASGTAGGSGFVRIIWTE